MKKTTLVILLCACAILANAQGRMIDLSAYSIISPDTVYQGNNTHVIFSLKNNGPDTLQANDTVLYYVQMDNGTHAIGVMGHTQTYSVLPGDTFNVDLNMGSMIVNTPHDANICVEAWIQSRGIDSVKKEVSTYGNNEICEQAHFGWMILSIPENPESASYKIYPNPVSDQLFIEYTGEDIHNIDLRMTDVAGKEVFSDFYPHTTQGSRLIIDATRLNNGIYFYYLSSGSMKQAGKLSVTH